MKASQDTNTSPLLNIDYRKWLIWPQILLFETTKVRQTDRQTINREHDNHTIPFTIQIIKIITF